MTRIIGLLSALLSIQVAAQEFTAQLPTDDLHFSPFGGHPHFVLNPGHRLVLEGQEAGEEIVLTITALNQTKPITLRSGGQPRTIQARVVEEKEVINDSLAEVGRFWYARSIETGDIYFFGEEVDFYFEGQIVGQTRLWEAGVDGALPGIVMPRTFLLGARYYQNQAAAALDGAENVALGLTMNTPAGTFSNCVQIRETDGLRSDLPTATKTYAPGVGLINDDDILLLKEFRLGTAGLPADSSFAPFSSHPFFPFAPGHRRVFEGIDQGQRIILTSTVLDEIKTVAVAIAGQERNVPTRVIEERKTSEGQLVESSRSFVAQCLETGDVHAFGREVNRYEDGVLIDQAGSWLAGVGGAEAGLTMPAHFAVGARYWRQAAPGIANDLAVNSASGLTATVPAGTFSNCVRVTVTSSAGPNPTTRELTYAPGIGLISNGEVLRLTSFSYADMAPGAPVLSIQDAVLLSWPLTGIRLRLQSSSDLQNWTPMFNAPVLVEGRNQISFPRDKTNNYFRLSVP